MEGAEGGGVIDHHHGDFVKEEGKLKVRRLKLILVFNAALSLIYIPLMEWLPAMLVFCWSALLCLRGTVERRGEILSVAPSWMGADSFNSCLCFCVCLRECSPKCIWQPLRVCTLLWPSFIWLTAVSGRGGRHGWGESLWALTPVEVPLKYSWPCGYVSTAVLFWHRQLLKDPGEDALHHAWASIDLEAMSRTNMKWCSIPCTVRQDESDLGIMWKLKSSWAWCAVWLRPLRMSEYTHFGFTVNKNTRFSMVLIKEVHSAVKSVRFWICSQTSCDTTIAVFGHFQEERSPGRWFIRKIV